MFICNLRSNFYAFNSAVVINNLEVNRRFISSIRQYTEGDYELIIIDNGSDDSNSIQHAKDSADIYFRFEKRTDLAKAWNKGISLSNGDYIAIVNNDVVVSPDWFKPLKETLDSNPSAGMVSPITYWIIKHIYFEYKSLKNFDKTFKNPFKLIKFKEIIWGEFFVFKRKALKDIGGFYEGYTQVSAEDLEMNFQLYTKGYDIFVDPRVYIYHEGGASVNIRSLDKKEGIYQKNFELFKSRWPKYTKGWK